VTAQACVSPLTPERHEFPQFSGNFYSVVTLQQVHLCEPLYQPFFGVTLYTYIQSISLPYGALLPRDEVPLPGRGVGVVCASSAENAWRDWRPLTATLSSNFYNLHAFIGCQIKLYYVSESESNSWHKTRIVRRDWVERSSKGRLMHFVNAKIVDTMS